MSAFKEAVSTHPKDTNSYPQYKNKTTFSNKDSQLEIIIKLKNQNLKLFKFDLAYIWVISRFFLHYDFIPSKYFFMLLLFLSYLHLQLQ